MSVPKRIALYYPTIKLPDTNWLRKTILYWDAAASIVPESLPLDDQMRMLKDEGLFSPVRPHEIEIAERATLAVDCLEVVDSIAFQQFLGDERAWFLDFRIHVDKASQQLICELVARGLARPEPIYEEGTWWFLLERSTALLFMAMLAAKISDQHYQTTSPSTDNSTYHAFVFPQMPHHAGDVCAEVLLKHILPIPAEGVAIAQIVQFRRTREASLFRLRGLVDQFQSALAQADQQDQIRDVTTRFCESVRVGIEDLTAELRDSKLEYVWSALTSLLSLKSPTLLAATATMAAELVQPDFHFSVPVKLLGLGGLGSVEVSSKFVSQINRRNSLHRQSPFAYLYEADKAFSA